MANAENLFGALRVDMEIKAPPFLPTRIYGNNIGARNRSFIDKATPPNHSSRDRSPQQLNISPTSRNRHGNKRI